MKDSNVKNSITFAIAILLPIAAMALAYYAPEALLYRLGSSLSPDREISAAILPTLHRFIVALLGAASFLLSMCILYQRKIISSVHRYLRQCRSEMKSLWRRMGADYKSLYPSQRIVIVVLTLIGVGLRLWYINQPMQFDEATTVNMYSSSPFYIGLANYSLPNNHLLNTLLVRISLMTTGYAEWSIRSSAFISGVGLMVIAFLYAARFYSLASGILALAVISVSMPFIDMATNARGYSIVALCGVAAHLSIYCMVTRGSVLAASCYALSIGLGLVAVPVAVIFAVSSTVYGILLCTKYHTLYLNSETIRIYMASALVGVIIAIAGYLPMLITLGPKWLFANEWVIPLTFAEFARSFPLQFYDYLSYSFMNIPLLDNVIIIALAIYLILSLRLESTRVPAPLVALSIGIAFLLLNRRYPFWGLSPMWMFITVLLVSAACHVMTASIARIAKPSVALSITLFAALLICVLGMYSVITTNPVSTQNARGTYANPDSHAIVSFLSSRLMPHDKVLADHPLAVYHYYSRRAGLSPEVWDWKINEESSIYILQERDPINRRYAEMLRHTLEAEDIDFLKQGQLTRQFSTVDVYVVPSRNTRNQGGQQSASHVRSARSGPSAGAP